MIYDASLQSMKVTRHCLLLASIFGLVCPESFDISDDVQLRINFLRPIAAEKLTDDVIPMMTSEKELYDCLLPKIIYKRDHREAPNQSAVNTELQLLRQLFAARPCSYLMENFWTYELCHEKYIRQYHEEQSKSDKKKTVRTEFYLGNYTEQPNKQRNDNPVEMKTKNDDQSAQKIPTVTLGRKQFPYYPVYYKSGTVCDLSGLPRETVVMYVCQPKALGIIVDVQELETCRYRMIVLTDDLCFHPSYAPPQPHVNNIHCHFSQTTATEDENSETFYKPKKLLEMEKMSINSRDGYSNLAAIFGKDTGHTVYGKRDGFGRTVLSFDKLPDDQSTKAIQPHEKLGSLAKLNDFVSGKHCITGGKTYWRHEYCFQKIGHQFHEGKSAERIDIILGVWDKEVHVRWLAEHPRYKPLKDLQLRKQVTHYLENGDFCDLISKPRRVLVTLKCAEDGAAAVSIQFSEPTTCQYEMKLEGFMFCALILKVDEYGVLPPEYRFT